jgi:hypothetical protein
MTGITALDVVIGLVFIYALYSLLITTIMEFVALIFQLRAKNLKRALIRIFDNEKTYEDFVKTPVIQSLYSNRFSWFFKVNTFPSYINAETFTKALNYMLIYKKDDKKTEIDDKNTLLTKISTEINKDEFNDKESYKYLRYLLEISEGNLNKFVKSVEEWYNATMERCGGWFKKNMMFLTFGIAFLLTTLFNIDSIEIIKELSKDKEAREQYIQLAGQMLANPVITNPTPVYDTNLEKRLLQDSSLFEANNKDSVAFLNAVTDSVNSHVFSIQKVLISRMDTLYATSQHAQQVFSFKRKGKVSWFFDSWLNLLGCLITALALSLGAPFWFDLLNKFMKLRTSLVTQPKKESSDTAKS